MENEVSQAVECSEMETKLDYYKVEAYSQQFSLGGQTKTAVELASSFSHTSRRFLRRLHAPRCWRGVDESNCVMPCAVKQASTQIQTHHFHIVM